MGADDSNIGTVILARGNGQSVFLGTNMEKGRSLETCDIRVMVTGLRYSKVSNSFILLRIDEPAKQSSMEIMLVEHHTEPVQVGNVMIFYTGIKEYSTWERYCVRCGQEQEHKQVTRYNGLIKFVAPKSVKIRRGDRPGKKL